jgi:hypothetical protein
VSAERGCAEGFMGGESVKTNSCMGRYLGIYLKGLCHEMNIFLKVLKIESVLSVYAPIVFLNFLAALLWRK